MPEIPHAAVKELADAGALCDKCGALHVSGIEIGIITRSVAKKTGAPIPWCDCVECPVCKDFRTRLEAIKAASAFARGPHSPEDSL